MSIIVTVHNLARDIIQRKLSIKNLVKLSNWAIGQMSRMFANDLGDQGSIPSRAISKTKKMVLDAALLNTQQIKVRTNGKVEQSRERSSALPYTSV